MKLRSCFFHYRFFFWWWSDVILIMLRIFWKKILLRDASTHRLKVTRRLIDSFWVLEIFSWIYWWLAWRHSVIGIFQYELEIILVGFGYLSRFKSEKRRRKRSGNISGNMKWVKSQGKLKNPFKPSSALNKLAMTYKCLKNAVFKRIKA